MSPRTAVLVIAGALVLAGVAWMLWAPPPAETPAEEPLLESQGAVVATADQPMVPATLYFLGEDGWLHGVEIEAPEEDGEMRVRALVDALLAGPRAQEGFLHSPLPGARLDGVYFLGESSVALDLRLQGEVPPDATADPTAEGEGVTEDDPDTPSTPAIGESDEEAASFFGRVGSKQELLAVYSLVNTVAMGSEAVEKVVLLLDGKQPETLAGHVDLARPLRPDPTWIGRELGREGR